MKKTSKTLKWVLFFLLIIKILATVFMFFSSELFHYLFPFGLTTEPFTIAYIFSKDKILVVAPLFAFIILPLCFLAGFLLLFICRRKALIPTILLAIPALSDIICMLQSFGTIELMAGKIVSIAFNLLILALLIIYCVASYKSNRQKP